MAGLKDDSTVEDFHNQFLLLASLICLNKHIKESLGVC